MITLTPRLAGLLTDNGVPAGRVHVIPSGVPDGPFDADPGADPLDDPHRPRVLYLGRLRRQKGVDVLVRAVAVRRS